MSDVISQLSEREREILKLVATGATNQQIAIDLGISINTVKVHLRNIFGKIGAASRTEASMIAMRAGLISMSPAEVNQPLEEELPIPTDRPALVQPEPVADTSPQSVALESTVVNATPAVPQQVPAHKPWMTLLGVIGGMLIALLILWLMGVRLPSNTPVTESATPGPGPGRTIDAVWTPHGTLPELMSAAAASSFEGRVYIIGGKTASGASAKGWSYDPETNAVNPIADKPTAVSNIQAVVFAGKLWIPGGDTNGTITNKLEAFDLKTMTWSEQAPMPEPRSAYASAVIDGRLYVFGGWDGSKVRSETFVYDPGNNTWSQDTQMPTARAYMASATVDGKVYVIGGEDGSGVLVVNEVYTPVLRSQGSWDKATPLPAARSRCTSIASINNILVFGGSQNELPARFDVRTLTWATLKDAPTPLGAQPAATTRDSSIFVVSANESRSASQLYEMRLLYNVYLPLP